MDGGKFSVEKLRSGGYETWRFKVEMLLVRENLWKYVSEAAPNPLTDAWKEGDAKARATIALLVDDCQHPLIRDSKTAQSTWDNIKNHHQKTTMTTKVSLLKKLCRAEYNENGDMEGHLFKMEELFSSLANAGQELDANLKVAMVLKSMPDSFDNLTTALETREDKDLTMDLVKGKLLDEAQKRMEKTHPSESILRVGAEKKIICHQCRKPGHMKRDCPMMKNEGSSTSGGRSGGQNGQPKHKPKGKAAKTTPFAFTVSKNRKLMKTWIVDSGATAHMCCDRSFFQALKPSSGVTITLADGNETAVQGIGSGRLFCYDDSGNQQEVILSDVFYVPDLESNLVSVGCLVNKGAEVTFGKSRGCVIQCGGVVAAVAQKVGGLYQLNTGAERSMNVVHHTKDCIHSWHRKLGHRDPEAIQRVVREGLAKGVSIKKCDIYQTCECCAEGKIARKPFPRKTERQSTKVLDLIHTDICGPMNTVTPGGSRYFLTMIDDHSRYTVVYFLKRKSDAADVIKEYVTMVRNRFGRNPVAVRSDQGGEYKAKRLGQFYRANGIVPQYTAGYSPQQNGVAERKNRTLVEMARCMLLDAKLGHRYWAEAINAAVYLQNILPSRSVEKTSFELWYGKQPDYSNLHIFGSAAIVHVPAEKRKKLDPKGKKLTFVGYADNHKAFRFIDVSTDKVTISRDAQFIEMEEPKTQNSFDHPGSLQVVEYEPVLYWSRRRR